MQSVSCACWSPSGKLKVQSRQRPLAPSWSTAYSLSSMLLTPSCCWSMLTAFLTCSTFPWSPHSPPMSPRECLHTTSVLLVWCFLLQVKMSEMMRGLHYGLPEERVYSAIHTLCLLRCVMRQFREAWAQKTFWDGAESLHKVKKSKGFSVLLMWPHILKRAHEYDHKQLVHFREYARCKCLWMIRKAGPWSSQGNYVIF